MKVAKGLGGIVILAIGLWLLDVPGQEWWRLLVGGVCIGVGTGMWHHI